MSKDAVQEQVLRASKEIAVKFIEVGRLWPTNFSETFKTIYNAIDATVRAGQRTAECGGGPKTGKD